MKNMFFENKGTTTYLVYELNPTDEIDSMSLGMIMNNQIENVAQTIFFQMDNSKFIKYDVTAKLSLKQFFSGIVSRKKLLSVFLGIVNAIITADDYMIDHNSFVLDLDYIFTDVTSGKTILICLPIIGLYSGVDFGAFFKNIMFSTQFDQTENCDYIAKIINFLNGNPVFSIYDFKMLLEGINNGVQPVGGANNTSTNNSVGVYTQKSNLVGNNNTMPVRNTVPVNTVKPEVETLRQTTPPIGVNTHQGRTQAVTPPIQNTRVSQSSTTVSKVNQGVQQNQGQNFSNQNPDEEPISLFYLLQHYNKENATKYKRQKDNKKRNNNVPVQKNPNAPFPIPQGSNAPFPIPQGSNAPFPIPQGSNAPSPIPQGSNAPFPIPQGVKQPFPVPQDSTANGNMPINGQPYNQGGVSHGYRMDNTPQESSMSFGNTTVLSGDNGETSVLGGETTILGDETTVLGNAPVTIKKVQKRAFITRVKTNDRVLLDKPVFKIGKERSYVDYFIGDNSYISRSHANIVEENGRYFIIDNNSKNHTYINGELILGSTKFELKSGDKFMIANEEFEFNIV